MSISRMLLMLALMLSLAVSCGDGDDDGDTNVSLTPPATPAAEEDPTPNTPRTPRTPTCLSTTQRNNIRTLLSRLSSRPVIDGAGTLIERNEDGTNTTTDFRVAFAFRSESADSWSAAVISCELAGGCEPTTPVFSRAEFRDGCFYVNDNRARIRSSTTNRLVYSITRTGVEGERISETETWNITPADKVTARDVVTSRGRTQSTFNFVEL